MSKITTLLFDFGGVLVDIDFPRTKEALLNLLGISPDDTAFNEKYQHWYMQIERGQIHAEKLIWNLQNAALGDMPQGKEVVDAWNAMLLDFPRRRIDLLMDLRKEYKVCLLSNTNEIHIDCMRRFTKNHYGIDDYEQECFDDVFYSYELDAHKPDQAIFEKAVKKTGVPANEILFIDDMKTNVLGAREAGLHAVQHDPSKEIGDVIHGYIAAIE